MTRQVLNQGRAIPLKKLLGMTEFPSDVMALYAEGYALTSYLVGRKDRRTFLGVPGGRHGRGLGRGGAEALRF